MTQNTVIEFFDLWYLKNLSLQIMLIFGKTNMHLESDAYFYLAS